MTYNPEIWLESAIHELESYVTDGFNKSVLDNGGNPVGDSVYEIVMEFPGAALDESDNPLQRTLIHFEVDDPGDRILGLGENNFADNYHSGTNTVNPQYAGLHLINFDVGIWSSAKAGGTTARIRARQILYDLLGSPKGKMAIQDFTDGGDGRLEIIDYAGGQFSRDTINDIPIFRMINSSLTVRVFSRTKVADLPDPAIEGIDQAPQLSITDSDGGIVILG